MVKTTDKLLMLLLFTDTKLWPEFSDIKNNVTRVMKNTSKCTL